MSNDTTDTPHDAAAAEGLVAEAKMDFDIAEQVFGHTLANDAGAPTEHDRFYLVFDEGGSQSVPPYSTDIAAAWTVVEHMKQAPFSTRHFFVEALREIMTVGEKRTNMDPAWWIFFLTPERICRSALAACRALQGEAGA